jgi:hypothetical protein
MFEPANDNHQSWSWFTALMHETDRCIAMANEMHRAAIEQHKLIEQLITGGKSST